MIGNQTSSSTTQKSIRDRKIYVKLSLKLAGKKSRIFSAAEYSVACSHDRSLGRVGATSFICGEEVIFWIEN